MPYDLKKLLAGAAAIGALGLGGSAIAGAATNNGEPPTAVGQPAAEAAEVPGTEVDDRAENNGTDEPETTVSAADQARAADAALAEVGSGKVTEISAETPDDTEAADTPEQGDEPDPASERRVAFDVEVTNAGGAVIDVELDKSFDVLGTRPADQDQGDDNEHNEQSDAAKVAPAK